MPPSYRLINYNLRPAKSVERKMLAEGMSRLSIFGKIEDYNYVGFGSTFFSDFLLLHSEFLLLTSTDYRGSLRDSAVTQWCILAAEGLEPK